MMGGKSTSTILVAGCLLATATASNNEELAHHSRFLRRRQTGSIRKYGTGEQRRVTKERNLDVTAEDVAFWTRTLQTSYPPLPTTMVPIPPTPTSPAPSDVTPVSPAPFSPAPIESTTIPVTPAPSSLPPTPSTPAPIDSTPIPVTPAPSSLPPIPSTPAPIESTTIPVTPAPSSLPPIPSTPAPIESTPIPVTPAPSSLPPIPSTPGPIESTPIPVTPAPSSLPPIPSTPAPSIPVPLTPAPSSLAPTFPPTPIPSTLNPTLTPSASPTQPCNLSPEERTTQIKELLSTVSDPALFDDPTTPQARALDWITNEDAIVPTLCPNFDGQGCKLDGQNPLVQRYSLATFYFATNGDAWNQCSAPENFDDAASVATANDGCNRVVTPFGVENERVGDTSTDAWLGPVNECFWGGVACWGSDTPNLNLCVDQLDFEDNGLTGVLVPELSVNPSMRFLILEQGNLTGTIPSEFGNLERLLIIDMDFNEITGTLPETLFDLSAMQQLDLNDNLITGTLSTRIGDMSSLTFLQIDHNKFSSTIPSEIGLMDNLRIAFLSVNDFTGVMPEEVCSLRNNTSTPGVLGVLVTDCSGSPPEVDCPCCSSCA